MNVAGKVYTNIQKQSTQQNYKDQQLMGAGLILSFYKADKNTGSGGGGGGGGGE